MKTQMNILGLVTARGGSKGIKGKNIIDLGGEPLITWTLKAAKAAQALSRVVVSTDDPAIAQVALQAGGEVPFMRPAELAEDDSNHLDVLLHALDWLEENQDYCPDAIMLLQPTSPLRRIQDIDGAVDLLIRKNAPAVVGVCEAANHPFLVHSMDSDGVLTPFMERASGYLRRQILPQCYVLNGSIYLIRCGVLREYKTLFPRGVLGWLMPPERSVDVDTPWDLHLARLIIEELRKK